MSLLTTLSPRRKIFIRPSRVFRTLVLLSTFSFILIAVPSVAQAPVSSINLAWCVSPLLFQYISSRPMNQNPLEAGDIPCPLQTRRGAVRDSPRVFGIRAKRDSLNPQ